MLQLKNDTPFKAEFFVFPDRHGEDTLYTVVKATFGLLPKVHVAENQVPVTVADEYWGEPGTSSLRYAAEAHLGKVGTDVVVVGEACAPDDQPTPELEVGLRIAGRMHGARVFGDREWKATLFGVKPSVPEPFVRMPLTYERAFGGRHVIDETRGKFLAEPRNPVGKGFWGKRGLSEMAAVGVPNVEDFSAFEKPVGFGFVAPSWEPRVKFAGTYDERWQKKRAPYLPDDFDPRFFNAAPPELTFAEPLKGGEDVIIRHMSPRGDLRFKLPLCELQVAVEMGGRQERARPVLETVLLEPTAERLSMSYRAALPCDKKALVVDVVRILMNNLQVDGLP